MGESGFEGLSIAALAGSIASRAASPVEITVAMLERIERLDPSLNAFVRITAERALADARRAEDEIARGELRGPLHGVPIALKDIIDTAGIETAVGTKVLAGRVPAEDATVAARLAEAGAVLLGKTALTEGAFSEHRPERPAPVNPWNAEHWTGVSSSGSGVAVAADLAFGALGTDTGGSIRFPCSACGVTGLKPGWGRVSRHGVFPLAPSLDHVGPIARSAADCALLFEAIAGPDPRDPTSFAAAAPRPDRELAGATIGIEPGVLASVDPAVAAVIEAAAAHYATLGCELREVRLPAFEPLAEQWAVTTGVEAAIAHSEPFAAAPDDYGPALRGLIELGRSLPAIAYAAAHQARLAFAGAMAPVHREADLVLLPVMPLPTPSLDFIAAGQNDPAIVAALLRFTAPINFSGQPSLTLPGGFDGQGLPIGLQLVGAPGSESLLLDAGRAFQETTDWHRRRPPLPPGD